MFERSAASHWEKKNIIISLCEESLAALDDWNLILSLGCLAFPRLAGVWEGRNVPVLHVPNSMSTWQP